MPPKTKVQPQHQADIKDDTVIQSVLLADPFGAEQSWGPLVKTDDEAIKNPPLPWCLLPLLGTPLLVWTLESLALGGVQQVFIFISEGIDQVRAFLSTTTYLESDSKLSVTILATSAFTPGDVMREVDSRALLKTKTGDGSDVGTFILAKCGYIGNLDLTLASERFASRRKADGGLPCLTTIVKSVPASLHTSRSIHLLTPNSRLVHFHMDKNKFPTSKRVELSADLFQQPQDLLLRSDLQSVGVEICSVEVPQLFTENFDYQHIKPDFIHGILTSDLLGKTILCEVVKESENLGSGTKWATLVESVKSYDTASRDILARRAQPFTLDLARPGGTRLTQRRGMIYVGKDVDLALDCKISHLSCIDSYSTISPEAKITHSYVGEHVQIGPGAQIIDSYIFDGVSVGPNTLIKSSVVGSNAKIQSDCKLEGGCLIGNGVVIGDKVKLRATSVSVEGPSGSKELTQNDSVGLVWPSFETGTGSMHDSDEEDFSDDEDGVKRIDSRNYQFARLGTNFRNCDLNSPASSITSFSSASSVASSSSPTGVENIDAIGEVGSTKDFLVECNHSLERAFEEGHTVENASIELKTLRMASNVSQSKVRSVVMEQVCGLVEREPTMLNKWAELVKSLLSGEDDLVGMEEVLFDLQGWSSDLNRSQGFNRVRFFSRMLQHFYNEDVVNEEGLLKWFTNKKSKEVGGEEGLKLREVGGKLLQMIMDSEEEDSD